RMNEAARAGRRAVLADRGAAGGTAARSPLQLCAGAPCTVRVRPTPASPPPAWQRPAAESPSDRHTAATMHVQGIVGLYVSRGAAMEGMRHARCGCLVRTLYARGLRAQPGQGIQDLAPVAG